MFSLSVKLSSYWRLEYKCLGSCLVPAYKTSVFNSCIVDRTRETPDQMLIHPSKWLCCLELVPYIREQCLPSWVPWKQDWIYILYTDIMYKNNNNKACNLTMTADNPSWMGFRFRNLKCGRAKSIQFERPCFSSLVTSKFIVKITRLCWREDMLAKLVANHFGLVSCLS